MSNYITVRNGLIKREIPTTPVSIEFTNNKGLKYVTTLNNGRAKQRDIEVIYSRPSAPEPYHGGITEEQIREAVEYVYRNILDDQVPGMIDSSFSGVIRVEDMSADEALRRGLITDIEYLDLISREDDNI